MASYLLYVLNGLYFIYLILATLIFAAMLPVVGTYKLLTGISTGEAFRLFNHLYGQYLIKMSWPIIRIARKGIENVPKNASAVVIVNHRSTSDIFFASLFTPLNTTIFIRSWPFRIWIFKWFMKIAEYIDIESNGLEHFYEGLGQTLKSSGTSFLFFPEGHRSRDGKLQNFKSGAFLIATEFNIPVIPVVLTGTEKFLPMKKQLIRPALITVEVLAPVLPDSFPEENRALKLRRHVQTLYKERLNEQ